MKTDSVVTLHPRNWHDVNDNRGQLILHATLFFIILHNNLLLNENEFAIRDWIAFKTVRQCFMIQCFGFFPFRNQYSSRVSKCHSVLGKAGFSRTIVNILWNLVIKT